MKIDRRRFGSLAVGSLASALMQEAASVQKLWARETKVASSGQCFYFAVIADSHIIDRFYQGPEGSVEDTESMYHTAQRLTAARDLINSLHPKIDRVFLVGDYFHNYPSVDYDFYFKYKTRLDHAKELTDGFKMPVHVGFGNHDYEVPRVSREMSHRLFAEKFQLKPYYVVDYKGYKFIHLNNALGETWDISSRDYNLHKGSFGEEQLNWLENQLREHKPTFVFTHYPLWDCSPTEVKDYGAHSLIRKYQDTIQLVVTGHWHKWINFDHTFGPQHYVMAATRYDPNAYMLMEVNVEKQTWRFMNEGLVEWLTHYSKPYSQSL